MPTPAPREETTNHWLTDALDGARYVWNEPAIRSTTVLAAIAFTLLFSVLGVILPVVYERLDQPRELGLLFVAFSGGGIAGALLYSAIGARLPRRPAFVGGLAVAAAVAGVFALAPPFRVQVVAMAVGGFLTGPVGPICNVVLQERTSEEMRGRALSMVFAFDYALYPVGYVVTGFLIKSIGVTETFAVVAVAAGLVALWSAVTPALRGINAPEALSQDT